MMKRLLVAGLFLAGLLVVSAQAGAAKPQSNRVKQTAKPIWTLAMDGPRAAYASGGRIYVWNVVTGATSVVKGVYAENPAPCCLGNFTPIAADEIAIAGKRVAWIRRVQVGNTELHQWLYTAPLGGSAHLLRKVFGYTGGGCGGNDGTQIGGVVGSGSVLAVSTWNASGDLGTSSQRLDLITPKGLRTIATGTGTIVSASEDNGHIAVVPAPTLTDPDYCIWTPATSVDIYTADGERLHKIETGPAAIALSGNLLVAATGTSTPSFEVYDWTTETLLHTWTVTGSPFDFAVSGQLAVYSVNTSQQSVNPKNLHLLDLTTGKDVVIATTRNSLYRDLAIGQRGLVYAINPYKDTRPGKLVFVPTAKLLATLSH